ncbi:hypothetical protein L1987_10990 [Smallanthus sonchifolius]|uniref:Uncharacterized protein n=1 Tax=Smallanthus sonchifolius TaxID=185202 RepID=A0ACB9JBW7_9ASTR|nr:hypothetical protein L1987_10990 [Smallanthus sonchifolius]
MARNRKGTEERRFLRKIKAAAINGCERSSGNLKFPANALVHRPKLLEYIIKTLIQVEAAFAFLTVTGSEDLDINKFKEACGVGVCGRTP